MPQPIAAPYFSSQALAAHGKRLALVEGDSALDYSQLADAVTRLLEAWQQLPAARILLVSDSQTAMIAALLAIAQTAHVAVPTAPHSKQSDLNAAARDAFASHRWESAGSPPFPASLKAEPPVNKVHPLLASLNAQQRSGLVLFTSGSTGRSKTILHDFARLLHSLEPTKKSPPRKVLLLMHPDHIGGVDVFCKTLALGSTLYVPPQRDPATVGQWIAKHAIEVLPATPTFLRLALLQGMFDQYDCRSLQIITYGAERMPPMLLEALRKTLPQVDFRATFGTTETGTIRLRGDRQQEGLLYPDAKTTDMRVVDGELWVKTPATLIGYLDGHSARIDDDGWIATGDLAEMSDDGGIRIRGRNQSLISIGGEKVDPAEVENALLQIDGILDAQIRAEPHALTGHVLAATIIAAPGYTSLSHSEWKQHIRRALAQQLPRWKIPTHLSVKNTSEPLGPRLKGHA